ncbi:MAG: hypothetical protein QOH97_2509, partial [Actinoplanes sp.]|nr:hypothetical protein [Actinoplanes sp.]
PNRANRPLMRRLADDYVDVPSHAGKG